MSEHVGEEGVHVLRVRGEVVEPVGGEPGVSEAAQVRSDDLEPASARAAMLRHQMRLLSGQPWTSSSG